LAWTSQNDIRMAKRKKKSAYAAAGVDIDEMMTSLRDVKRMIRRTATSGVHGDFGSFGGMFASPGRDHILVSSTDSVGTKLKVAHLAGRHDTVGQDIVNHCVNDVLVHGARPLFFLDYLGVSKLEGPIFRDIVRGLCKACRANDCALIGGETAELPGLYPSGEYDLVGTVVGSVPRRNLVTGKRVARGNVLIGLPSSGLHTNGYSLARKIIFDRAGLGADDLLPGTRRTVADTLLAVHRSYLRPVQTLMQRGVAIRGMAHITGGGLIDNVPRVLPDGLAAVVDPEAWQVPPVFRFIQERGRVDREEMFRVFNMGIGYVVIVGRTDVDRALGILTKQRIRGRIVGTVERGTTALRLA